MRKIIGFMLVAMAAIVLANCEAPGVATPTRTPPQVTAPAADASSGTAAQTGGVASLSPPSWIHGRWGVNNDRGEVSDRDGWTFTADDVLNEGDWVNGSMRAHSETSGATLTENVIEEVWGFPMPTSSRWSILIRATYTITLAREGMSSLTYRWERYGHHHLNYYLSRGERNRIDSERLTRRTN